MLFCFALPSDDPPTEKKAGDAGESKVSATDNSSNGGNGGKGIRTSESKGADFA